MSGSKRQSREKYTVGPDIDVDVEELYEPDGTRITAARAEQIAEEELAKAYRGRPSLTGRHEHSPNVTFRAPPELRERAEAQAHAEGRRLSDIARDALEEYLANHRAS